MDGNKHYLTRVDPENCGCTDCLTGYSKPINQLNQKELVKLYAERLENASGAKIKATVYYEY